MRYDVVAYKEARSNTDVVAYLARDNPRRTMQAITSRTYGGVLPSRLSCRRGALLDMTFFQTYTRLAVDN